MLPRSLLTPIASSVLPQYRSLAGRFSFRPHRIGFWRARRLLSYYVFPSWHSDGLGVQPGLGRSGHLQSFSVHIALPQPGAPVVYAPRMAWNYGHMIKDRCKRICSLPALMMFRNSASVTIALKL